MKDTDRYVKVVARSDEDGCYIGSGPGLIFGGCHGDDEKAVFAELCDIVEEAVSLCRADGRELAPRDGGIGRAGEAVAGYRGGALPFARGTARRSSPVDRKALRRRRRATARRRCAHPSTAARRP